MGRFYVYIIEGEYIILLLQVIQQVVVSRYYSVDSLFETTRTEPYGPMHVMEGGFVGRHPSNDIKEGHSESLLKMKNK